MRKAFLTLICLVLAFGPSCSLPGLMGDVADSQEELARIESEEEQVAAEQRLAEQDKLRAEQDLLLATSEEEAADANRRLEAAQGRIDDMAQINQQLYFEKGVAVGRAQLAEERLSQGGEVVSSAAGAVGGPAAGATTQMVLGGGALLAMAYGRLKALA